MKAAMLLAVGLTLCSGVALAQQAQLPPAGERPQRLPELVLGSDTDDTLMSQKSYELVAGQAYRLEVTNAGMQEYMFRAPDLFRNALIRQIVVEDLEVHTNWIHGLEFDAKGTMEVFFTPVKTGDYDFFIEPFQDAMRGRISVKAKQ
ncbi:hypothetical protein [Azospirillum sp. SYSU D00513]|uniref:hypothetical protein n=1 Tax=Azospirillum sp. SYSU D00513 TaxID=2812561 RepID=UPI001A96AFA5|nr:hypothetical protein [Azospirillum sp. SYSU D00513]